MVSIVKRRYRANGHLVKTFLLRKGESSLFTKFKFTEADVTFYQKSKFAISLHKSKNSFTLTLDKTLRFLFVGVLIITKTEKTIKTVDKKKNRGNERLAKTINNFSAS